MTPKKKICPTCKELKYLWNKSVGCKECCAANKTEKKPFKARSPIKKVSGKRAKELAVYSALRKSFLEINNICQICLSLPSCDVHHIYAGADRAKYLNDTSTWMALCRDCHQNKVHLDPVNARLNGWLK